MLISDMTPKEIDGLLILALTNIMINQYPLERVNINEHVTCMVAALRDGLHATSTFQMLGAMEREVMIEYSARAL